MECVHTSTILKHSGICVDASTCIYHVINPKLIASILVTWPSPRASPSVRAPQCRGSHSGAAPHPRRASPPAEGSPGALYFTRKAKLSPPLGPPFAGGIRGRCSWTSRHTRTAPLWQGKCIKKGCESHERPRRSPFHAPFRCVLTSVLDEYLRLTSVESAPRVAALRPKWRATAATRAGSQANCGCFP